MASPFAELAIQDALGTARAILKFISPNDTGQTGSHQAGFYLPKKAWSLYSPHPPTDGENLDSHPKITWQNGEVTKSRVIWYGKGTRSEYRLTRFGHGFPYLTEDNVGDLLVIVPESHEEFRGYVLDLEDDIEEVVTALGVELLGTWGVYDPTAEPDQLSEDDCIDKRFREFAGTVQAFPTTSEISGLTLQVVMDCLETFSQKTSDAQLMELVSREYELFQLIERELCRSQVAGQLFKSVDEFLKVAASIMNRRKSRAGRALENHFEHLLRSRSINCEVRPTDVDGKPDVILPSADAYNDESFPAERLCMIGLKTTCKDRWRQIVNEAQRIPRKHIVTLQQGISTAQLAEMKAANVTLVVPRALHRFYPMNSGIDMLTVDAFLRELQRMFGESS